MDGTTSRNSVPFAAACLWARISMLIPDESQNLVAVMSAMTVLTPGVKAEPSCWPARSALAMSISAGSAMTAAGKCCGSATRAVPFGRRQLSRGPGFPGGHGPTGLG